MDAIVFSLILHKLSLETYLQQSIKGIKLNNITLHFTQVTV